MLVSGRLVRVGLEPLGEYEVRLGWRKPSPSSAWTNRKHTWDPGISHKSFSGREDSVFMAGPRYNQAEYMPEGYILKDNLCSFAAVISNYIGYDFDDWDEDAIRFGTEAALERNIPWFEYELLGTALIKLRTVTLSEDKIWIVVVCEPEVESLASGLIWANQLSWSKINRPILLKSLEMTFKAKRPELFFEYGATDSEQCIDERQLLCEIFDKPQWQAIDISGVPTGVLSYMTMLSCPALEFVYPVFLSRAIQDWKAEWLDQIDEIVRISNGHHSMEPPTAQRLLCNPFETEESNNQRSFVVMLRHHLQKGC